jgi:hypothetical protein
LSTTFSSIPSVRAGISAINVSAGTDLEYALVRLGTEEVGHERDYEGL